MSTRPNTQSELIAQLLDPELSGALLNSVSSSFKEGRVTAVVAKKQGIKSDWKSGHVGPRTPITVSPQ